MLPGSSYRKGVRIILVRLNTSGRGQKELGMWAQQGATLTREDSEWSRKFEEPWQFEERDWRGVGHAFLQGRVKGTQDPLTRQGGDALSAYPGNAVNM